MKHFGKRYDGNCMLRETRPAKILGLEKKYTSTFEDIFGKQECFSALCHA